MKKKNNKKQCQHFAQKNLKMTNDPDVKAFPNTSTLAQACNHKLGYPRQQDALLQANPGYTTRLYISKIKHKRKARQISFPCCPVLVYS